MTFNDILTIQSSLPIWELVECIATALVAIGVIGEALIDSRFIKSHRLYYRKIMSYFVAIGVTGELVALIAVITINDRVTDALIQAIKFSTALGMSGSGDSL